jgi:trehalose 6-phosphate synthase
MMTRGLSRRGLAGLYRACDVGLVTPLRDGMNLVAKEYVAAQDPENPGVLVLSRFAGSARELTEALIVNPHDTAGMADVLKQALEMPLEERKERWQALHNKVRTVSANTWATDFLAALETTHAEANAGAAEQPVHQAEIVPLRTASGERGPRLLSVR